MKIQVGTSAIEIVRADITESEADAIVNAANSELILGGGVAGAIRRKGGPSIQEECLAIGHCPVGGAVMTGGGRLKAKHVIHAVGPRMGEGEEEEKLRGANLNSLKRAEEKRLSSIAFPAISSGIFGFPMEACARVMLQTTHRYLSGKTGIKHVVFALFSEEARDTFTKTARSLGFK
ncbi:MAG: macro domain-containing protein [Nitrospinales bacterium]